MKNQDIHSSTTELSGTLYHELSYVGHYLAVGDTYWDHYITHIINHSGYGDDKTGKYAGYCGVGEMWGYYSGNFYLAKELCSCNLDKISYINKYYWYNPNIMVNIGNYAHTMGYTYGDLYKTLNPEVHSLEALRGQWIQMGLKEEDVDGIIKKCNGWKE